MFAQHLSKMWFRSKKHSSQLLFLGFVLINLKCKLKDFLQVARLDFISSFNLLNYWGMTRQGHYFFATIGGSINSVRISARKDDN